MQKGFTLIELLLTVGIIVLITGVAFLNLSPRRNAADLSNTAGQITAFLREAQNNAMAQAQGVAWGVYFSNVTSTAPFYALFSSSYSTSTTVSYARLPATVAYATSTLAVGATTSITFSQVVGTASASTTIGVYFISQSSQSSTISVASSGRVSY